MATTRSAPGDRKVPNNKVFGQEPGKAPTNDPRHRLYWRTSMAESADAMPKPCGDSEEALCAKGRRRLCVLRLNGGS
eukprot:10478575-Alexandrium_andersonii.AAC.1